MIGKKIKDGFVDFANIEFSCPFCGKVYYDENEKYLNRCNHNKKWCTKIKCSCNKVFYMTYNYKGDAISFKL